MKRPLIAVDLFCGAGGTSTGLARAAERSGRAVHLTAINHWSRAVETHAANHPHADHLCATLEGLDPMSVVPGGKLDVLVASPACTHHSTARGGVPMSDQSRASGWHVVHWAEILRPEHVLVENVPELRSWGPLGRDGRPVASRKGETFEAWLTALRSLGYTVEHRVLNAADYGDPTTRRRLFVLARRGRRRPAWPAPTHAATSRLERGLFDDGAVTPWRSAREAVIDWSLPGASIFDRAKPLADSTLRRIAEGLRRFGGEAAEPFLLALTHGGRLRSLDEPLPTITAANRGELGVVQPFLVPNYGERDGQAPRTHSLESPCPTIPATGGGKFSLVQPFLAVLRGTGTARHLDRPLPTLTAGGEHHALVQPFMLGQQSGGAPRGVDDPTPTLAAKGAVSLIEPFLVPYYGTGSATSLRHPLPTATTRDRFGLAQPTRQLDILFRMLQPHELARAMGFPEDYVFVGNRTEIIRQIGNAVCVGQAEALCRAILEAA